MHGATAPSGPWAPSKDASIRQQVFSFPYSQIVFCVSVPSEALVMLSLHKCFYQMRSSHWRSGASLAAWVITSDLPGMGDPVSSYATVCTVFRIL